MNFVHNRFIIFSASSIIALVLASQLFCTSIALADVHDDLIAYHLKQAALLQATAPSFAAGHRQMAEAQRQLAQTQRNMAAGIGQTHSAHSASARAFSGSAEHIDTRSFHLRQAELLKTTNPSLAAGHRQLAETLGEFAKYTAQPAGAGSAWQPSPAAAMPGHARRVVHPTQPAPQPPLPSQRPFTYTRAEAPPQPQYVPQPPLPPQRPFTSARAEAPPQAQSVPPQNAREENLKVLGLGPSATPDDIKKAYRAMARRLHPDRNLGNPNATANFQALGAAYAALGGGN